MIKIAITGASGRMGQSLVKLVHENPNTQLVGAIVRTGNDYISNDALKHSTDTLCHVPFSDDASRAFKDADVVIDFCPAGATEKHLELAIQHNTKLVIGTTGLDKSIEEKIKMASQKISIVYASNFSIGVNLMFALSEKAGKILNGAGFETHIEETHHIHKLDAPSGTALSIGKAIATGKDTDFNAIYKYEQPRTSIDDITFTDIREGEVIGDHTVSFTHPLESFSMTHNAHNRSVFASGAITASIWVANKSNKLFSMQDVLGV